MARPKTMPLKIARWVNNTAPYVHAAEAIAEGVDGNPTYIRRVLPECVELGLLGRTADNSNGAGVAYYAVRDPDTDDPLTLEPLRPAELAMLRAFRSQMEK